MTSSGLRSAWQTETETGLIPTPFSLSLAIIMIQGHWGFENGAVVLLSEDSLALEGSCLVFTKLIHRPLVLSAHISTQSHIRHIT